MGKQVENKKSTHRSRPVRGVHHSFKLRLPRRRLLAHLLQVRLLLLDALGAELGSDLVTFFELGFALFSSLFDAPIGFDLRRFHFFGQRRLLLLELGDGDLAFSLLRVFQNLGVLDEFGELGAHRVVELGG